MKDKKLEEQFNEYFGGVELPEDIAADAVKQVKAQKRHSAASRIIKYCSIAAAVILCCTVTLVGLARSGIFKQDDEASAPPAVGGTPSYTYYGDGELTYKALNPYAASGVHPSLEFLENLALYNNAYVKADECSFDGGERALIKADVTYVDGARYDAEIYIEFTDKRYSPVSGYAEGTQGYYRGHEYFLTQETAENGEPVNKLYFEKDGLKYYLYVESSDSEAYLKYLYFIFK